MASTTPPPCCACPGCENVGTATCSGCKAASYCSSKCQSADWPHHKEECEGRLLKQGMIYFEKARAFEQRRDNPQILRFVDLSLEKLNKLKDRPVEVISDAMKSKYDALNMMGRDKEAFECAKGWYCLWLTKHTHPPAIAASFALIESCIHNGEFSDARLYAHTTWETITLSRDSNIPDNDRQRFTSLGAYFLAKVTLALCKNGDVPPEGKASARDEAIMYARKSLEIQTRLYGAHSNEIGGNVGLLAQVLDYFNDEDDEAIRLYEQAKTIYARVRGRSSMNVAVVEESLGVSYHNRAKKAVRENLGLDRELLNLDLSLPHYREAARIYREIDQKDQAERSLRKAIEIGIRRQLIIEQGAVVTSTKG